MEYRWLWVSGSLGSLGSLGECRTGWVHSFLLRPPVSGRLVLLRLLRAAYLIIGLGLNRIFPLLRSTAGTFLAVIKVGQPISVYLFVFTRNARFAFSWGATESSHRRTCLHRTLVLQQRFGDYITKHLNANES